jgi:NAD(P)-dependent dehydrogenase (short-subunit alcohol dehydrogenase family)
MMVGEEDVLNQMIKEQPIGRLGRPKEIAAAGLWLCAKARTAMLWPSTAATRRGLEAVALAWPSRPTPR